MLPEPGSAADWLRHARSDLALAQQPPASGVLWETLCFHAQQAVERSVKAVLVHLGIEFPKTHSVERLTDLLPPLIARCPALLSADGLTVYATVLRYPGAHEAVSEGEFREALRLAQAIVAWAERSVSEGKAGPRA
jgi:HEPN domain-containing protein